MSLEITGRITQVLSMESGQSKAGKEWRKQSFVLDSGAQFNPLVCFSLFGDEKINMLRDFGSGQEVKVSFNVSSREYNGRWYHNLDAWKLEGVGAAGNAGAAPLPSEEPMPAANQDLSADEEDDLPF